MINNMQIPLDIFDKVPPISKEELDKQNREFRWDDQLTQQDWEEIKDQLIRMNCWNY